MLGSLAGFGAMLSGGAFNALGATKARLKERVIKVQAKKFVYTPNQIVVEKGQPVILEFTSVDFIHGFNVPDMKIRSDLQPGRITRIRLNTEQAGTYDFLCDNFCGSGHEEMNGRIIVKG